MGTRSSRLSVALVIALAACGGSAPAAEPQASVAPVQTTIGIAPSFAATAPIKPLGPTEVATVLSITDGDTIRVDRGRGSEPVRYIGMDAPEPKEPGGSAATAANIALVDGHEVVLERDVSDVDQFDRLLRYVWLHDGSTWTLVNLELITSGVAKAATYPPDVQYQQVFTSAQLAAQSAQIGVWGLVTAPTKAPGPTERPVVGAKCHPSYDPCLPIVDDMNCPEVRALGLAPVRVVGPDDYRLDADHDGIGCD